MTDAETIASLQKHIDEAETEIKDLKEEISELKDRIDELESDTDPVFLPEAEDGERGLIEWLHEQVKTFGRDPLELLREKFREYEQFTN